MRDTKRVAELTARSAIMRRSRLRRQQPLFGAGASISQLSLSQTTRRGTVLAIMVLAVMAEAIVAVAICHACPLRGAIVADEINRPGGAVAKLVLRRAIPKCR